MNSENVLAFAESSIYTLLQVTGPLLILAVVVGLLISIFQATTQIQEQTLAFVPKIIAVLVGVVVLGPWMLTTMVEFTMNIFQNLNQFCRVSNARNNKY
ncbi:flagellar biosynthesis protein FliQ [Oceanobacillus senegalensis]|uniref:flagellar biosynthesis protein FliQ n=1 Tax=Oceanobacillus senegalensis TaxID=1936063 RepID=UPI000A30A0E2|nr:flagellar biosynthesis protein FliQ [Oceanobacillus senegalensis]